MPMLVKFQYVYDGYVKFDDDDYDDDNIGTQKKRHGNLNACILSNEHEQSPASEIEHETDNRVKFACKFIDGTVNGSY